MADNPAPGFKTHPNHRITLDNGRTQLRLSHKGTVIAQTDAAIALQENRYPVRYYIPQTDINMTLLTPTDRATHCPFKGDARYWTLSVDGDSVENIAWAYDAPFDEMVRLEGRIAFDTDRLDTVEIRG